MVQWFPMPQGNMSRPIENTQAFHSVSEYDDRSICAKNVKVVFVSRKTFCSHWNLVPISIYQIRGHMCVCNEPVYRHQSDTRITTSYATILLLIAQNKVCISC